MKQRIILGLIAGLLTFGAHAQESESLPKPLLYGGPDAGELLGKSIVATNQLDWSTAWVKNLGGQPPRDLPAGYIGVLVFASYPGHIISLHHVDGTAAGTIRCHQAPLPDSRSNIAPASWAAGMFKANKVKLEDCP